MLAFKEPVNKSPEPKEMGAQEKKTELTEEVGGGALSVSVEMNVGDNRYRTQAPQFWCVEFSSALLGFTDNGVKEGIKGEQLHVWPCVTSYMERRQNGKEMKEEGCGRVMRVVWKGACEGVAGMMGKEVNLKTGFLLMAA